MTPLNAPINFIEETWIALNPFSAHQIDIWWMRFATVEHAYQWSKFSDENIRKLIFDSKSPLDAWKIAQQYKSKVIPNFSKDMVMESLFRAKMEQHIDVIETLKLSWSRELLKNVLTDNYWWVGSDWSGQNKMGKLWMKLREEIIQNVTENSQN